LSGAEVTLLGAIAGFTIFLGLPFARLHIALSTKALLNAIALGILLFLLWDVLSGALGPIEEALEEGAEEGGEWGEFALRAGIFVVCFGVGLLSLVYYDAWLGKQRDLVRRGPGAASVAEFESTPGRLTDAQRLALFIATGIGLHNFSEGLAIGQSAAAGEIGLALALIVGFGLHNATEGFGIIAPLSGERALPSWSFLALLGLIGGGPTFLGTIVGRSWVSDEVSIAFLALAAGSILFVINELFHVGGIIGSKKLLMWGVLLGLMLGLATDWVIEAAEESSKDSGAAAVPVTMTDYSLGLTSPVAPAGRVKFEMANQSKNLHEFVVLRTDLAADSLPVREGTVDEEDPRVSTIGEVEGVKGGSKAALSLRLDAGHYVLICNLPAHYQLGMRADFDVK
jgi:ZIP family zinc transporter